MFLILLYCHNFLNILNVCRCFWTFCGIDIFGDDRSHAFCAHQNTRCTGVDADHVADVPAK